MTVQAFAALEAGRPLEPFQYDPGPLGPGEIEIAVTHCGICHSDVHLIDNDWKISRFPLVPGHEIVGTVTAVGTEVRGVGKGERVGVGWQSGSCMVCESCVRGEETCCAAQEATCVGRHGGFARSVRVDGRYAFAIPEPLASHAAAPLLCGGATVYTPLREHARPWSRVGVIGIGGLGHLALQFARAFGCEVTAFSTSPGKEAEARRFGAHRFVVSRDAAQMRSAAGSLDVLLSTVFAAQDWNAWVSLLRPKGHLAMLGASLAPMDLSPMALVVGNKSAGGSTIGTRAAIREMLDFASRHGISAQTEVVPMSDVNAAIDKVRTNRARYRMVLAN